MTEEARWRRPVTVGGLKLQSSVGLAPLNTGLMRPDSAAGAHCLPFYESFLSPYLGLLTIGGVAVSDEGRANASALTLSAPAAARLVSEVTARANEAGVRVSLQLEHAGRQTRSVEVGAPSVAASALPCPVVGETPRELTVGEIQDVVGRFVSAAVLSKAAGASYVEIHAAHGYLISGFLSRVSNRRTDAYGGSLANRYRILREIVQGVAETSGIGIGVRVNCREQGQWGQTPQDVVDGLRPIARHIDYVSISAGMYALDGDLIMPRRSVGTCLWRAESRFVRKALAMSTAVAGNVLDVAMADDILESGDADLVLFGRALLADSEMLTKATTGQSVQPCTDCGKCKYHSRGLAHIYCPFHTVLNPRHRRSIPTAR